MAKDIAEIQFNKTLGALIRKKRKNLGLLQKDMAKLLGITFQQFQKYEAGKNTISAYRLHKISIALGTSFAPYIYGRLPEFNDKLPDRDKIKSILLALEQELL